VVAGTQHWIPRCQLYTATHISPSVRPCVRAWVRAATSISIYIHLSMVSLCICVCLFEYC